MALRRLFAMARNHYLDGDSLRMSVFGPAQPEGVHLPPPPLETTVIATIAHLLLNVVTGLLVYAQKP